MVEPDTNGIVLLNPWVAPEARFIMFTGPGVMDMVSEKMLIAISWDIIIYSINAFIDPLYVESNYYELISALKSKKANNKNE
jgi:hypothetical protein